MYHGPQGLRQIAGRIHRLAAIFAEGMKGLGFKADNTHYFDTLTFTVGDEQQAIVDRALAAGMNLRIVAGDRLATEGLRVASRCAAPASPSGSSPLVRCPLGELLSGSRTPSSCSSRGLA